MEADSTAQGMELRAGGASNRTSSRARRSHRRASTPAKGTPTRSRGARSSPRPVFLGHDVGRKKKKEKKKRKKRKREKKRKTSFQGRARGRAEGGRGLHSIPVDVIRDVAHEGGADRQTLRHTNLLTAASGGGKESAFRHGFRCRPFGEEDRPRARSR